MQPRLERVLAQREMLTAQGSVRLAAVQADSAG